MMHRFALAATLAMTACGPNFDTIDEACHERVPGAQHGTDEAEDTLSRINCHRRVAGISRLRLHPNIQEAAVDQARSGELRSLDQLTQVLREQNYAFSQARSFALWSMLAGAPAELSPAARVDQIMAEPYLRQVLLQPSSRHAGAAQDGDLLSMVLTYDYPPRERSFRTIVYPADGQLDAPATWLSRMEGVDGIPSGMLGYPITVTVGGSTDQPFGSLDPHGIEVRDVVLEGPDGPIEVAVVLPSNTQVLLMFTALFVPLSPLEPDADYAFSARVTWSSGGRTVRSEFRTAG